MRKFVYIQGDPLKGAVVCGRELFTVFHFRSHFDSRETEQRRTGSGNLAAVIPQMVAESRFRV